MPVVIVITDAKLLLFHIVSDKIKDKTISKREYNDRTVYDCFNNPFSVDSGTPDLNLPPIPIYYSSCLNKRARYTSGPFPDAIYVASGNYVRDLITPTNSVQMFEPIYDDHDANHTIMSENPFRAREKRGYCSRFHGAFCGKEKRRY